MTLKPVIGVPVSVKLEGLDSLLSIAQMPPGVPVGCVGIDSARNAGILAAEILALDDQTVAANLEKMRESWR
jgi:5-(carboxyamino)imidazole ribonucleotide mutase